MYINSNQIISVRKNTVGEIQQNKEGKSYDKNQRHLCNQKGWNKTVF